MLRRLGIRGKVLAALSVPVLVLFMMAGLLSWQSIERAQTARTVTSLLAALQDSRELALALELERALSMSLVRGSLADPAELETARADVNQAIGSTFHAINAVELDDLSPRVVDEVGRLRDRLDQLESIRSRVEVSSPAPPMTSVESDYSTVIDAVIEFPKRVGDVLDDRPLAAILSAHAEVTATADHYRREQALGAETLRVAPADEADLEAMAREIPESDIIHLSAVEAVGELGLGESVTMPFLGASFEGFASFEIVRSHMATGERVRLQTISPEQWSAYADAEVETFDDVQSALRRAAIDRASDVASAENRIATLTIAVALAAIILPIMIALAMARQIINPLRRLTEAAGQVRDELPHLVEQVAIPGQGPDLRLTRIPVDSRDEVGQLAVAFNEVNQTTIEVAQEQAALRASIAEMFVNVARRDQVLLNRQLSFIDALERSEEDPKTLADLFRLDHLATRMRRNAESLLVLAGIDTGRRLRGSLPTSDVIRTASSEIEHYERIQLDLPIDPFMLGHIALPAAHMLAELLENATVFSDPGAPVHVSTGIDEHSVIITIEDQGLGMSAEELAQANNRIAATSASDVLGSQRLGLFVVGRIATRLGVTVQLGKPASGTGTRVTVRFPLVLFVDPEAIPLTPPSQAPAVETFVPVEEAAVAAHDSAYVPAGSGAWDVPAGAIGSVENPAEPVDLMNLTDGTTGLGLPRRRSRGADEPAWDMGGSGEGDSASPSIPLAPKPDSLAGAAHGRPPGDGWTPPLVQGAALSARRDGAPEAPPAGAGQMPSSADGLASRRAASPGTPSASGLPSRQPVPLSDEGVLDTASASGPANVEGRTAIFAGFRSRRAELAAAAIHETGTPVSEEDESPLSEGDGAERLAAAAAGAASFFGRHAARSEQDDDPAPEAEVMSRRDVRAAEPAAEPAQPLVIPSLEDDDEYPDTDLPAEAAPVTSDDFGGSRTAPEADAGTQPWQAEQGTQWPSTAPSTEPQAEPWAPAPELQAEPWAPAPELEPQAQPWAPAPQLEAQPWAPAPEPELEPQAQPWAPAPAPEPELELERQAQPWLDTPPATADELPAAVTPEPPADDVDFAALVDGPSRRSIRPQPKRRRLFGRSKKAEVDEPVSTELDPWAATVQESLLFAGGHGPVRQSAWNSAETGSHTNTEPSESSEDVPAVEPAEATPWAAPPSDALPARTPQPPPVAAQWTAEPGVAPEPASAWGPTTPAEPEAAATPEVPADWAPALPPAGAAPATPWGPPAPPAAPEMPAAWAPEPGIAPEPAAWGPAFPAAAPEPTPAPEPAPAPRSAPPPAPQTNGAQNWAPAAPNWSHASGMPAAVPPSGTAPAPSATPTGQTTFTPQTPTRTFDDEMTNMLAQRADIAQQALSELSQLSTYRPQAVVGGGAQALARRTPASVPAAPEFGTTSSAQRPARDAAQVRSLLSSFQSGTSRGREMAEQDVTNGDGAHQSAGDNGLAGDEEGPQLDTGQPVTTPDTDLDPRSATW